jgi:hypothetical protein
MVLSRRFQFALNMVVATGGLASLLLMQRQVSLQAEAMQSAASTSLAEPSFTILAFIADRPSLYPYFYERKVLAQNDPHRIEVRICCEMIANYCENLTQQRDSMSAETWASWQRFIAGQFDASPSLREFLADYRDWYGEELIAIVSSARDK